MKTKKLSKKLGLNKITIAQLNNMDLTNIKGGAAYTSLEICLTCGSGGGIGWEKEFSETCI